jgi:succinyl-diaminopimelate desuccinylase
MDVIELFKLFINSKSETPADGELLTFISEYLSDFTSVRVDKNEVKNLFIYKKFGDSEKHLCFAGHVDVVPAGDGWDTDPYEVVEKTIDGVEYLFGRGCQDMKSGVAAFTQAVKEAENFNGTLSLLLTSDEEGPAKHGTLEVLEYLKSVDMMPESVIVAEPTCEKTFGDAIKVGRRGSINGVLKVTGKQGHAAYPEKAKNPIHEISDILPRIAGYNLDNGDEFFSPSKLVITDIRSGMEVTNVSPGTLKMMFNVRNSTKTDQDSIREFITTEFLDLEQRGLTYTLELDQSAYPFVTDSDTHIVKTIGNSIQNICGVQTKHSTAGGTSDARYIAPCGVNVIEFGVRNDTIHAPNERTTKAEIEGLYKVFCDVIKNY